MEARLRARKGKFVNNTATGLVMVASKTNKKDITVEIFAVLSPIIGYGVT